MFIVFKNNTLNWACLSCMGGETKPSAATGRRKARNEARKGKQKNNKSGQLEEYEEYEKDYHMETVGVI